MLPLIAVSLTCSPALTEFGSPFPPVVLATGPMGWIRTVPVFAALARVTTAVVPLLDLSRFFQGFPDRCGWYGKTDTRSNRGTCTDHAYHPALLVDQRPAGIPRVDGGIGLQAMYLANRAWLGTDDAACDREPKAERVTERQHGFPQPGRISTQREVRQLSVLSTGDGQIQFLIQIQGLPPCTPAILEHDQQGLVCRKMSAGDDQTIIEHKATANGCVRGLQIDHCSRDALQYGGQIVRRFALLVGQSTRGHDEPSYCDESWRYESTQPGIGQDQKSIHGSVFRLVSGSMSSPNAPPLCRGIRVHDHIPVTSWGKTGNCPARPYPRQHRIQ